MATTASSYDITAINLLMILLVLVCKWSIVQLLCSSSYWPVVCVTLQGNMCSVYLYKQGREVDFPINVMQLVTPQKQDKVNTKVVAE